MRTLKKICAIVYLLAAVVVVGGFACLQFGADDTRERFSELLEHSAGRIVLIVCLILLAIGVLATVVVTLVERRPPVSVHPAGNPNIEVRLTAITSVARAAAQEEDVLVERVSSRVVGRDASQVRVTLELIAFSEVGLESLGKRIQLHVEEACNRMLGAEGVMAQIRFLPSKTTTISKEVAHDQG